MEAVVSRWHIAYFHSSGALEQSAAACMAQIFFFFSGGQKEATTGSFHCIASALARAVDTPRRLLRWILKRQYRKADSPIHYKASRITFSSDTVEPRETQFSAFLEMETIWPRLANSPRLCTHWQQRRCNSEKNKKKLKGPTEGISFCNWNLLDITQERRADLKHLGV